MKDNNENENYNNDDNNDNASDSNTGDNPLIVLAQSLIPVDDVYNANYIRSNPISFLIDSVTLPITENKRITINFGDISLFTRLFNVEVFGVPSNTQCNLTIGGVTVFIDGGYDNSNMLLKVKEITGDTQGLTTLPIELHLNNSIGFKDTETIIIRLTTS